ncbi:hypothetical protein Y032_0180g758 [Ancylostoma ceylanicum]|nr:hypothetical protein Y032_0180g758 [Ancylostoma ceylanicum]
MLQRVVVVVQRVGSRSLLPVITVADELLQLLSFCLSDLTSIFTRRPAMPKDISPILDIPKWSLPTRGSRSPVTVPINPLSAKSTLVLSKKEWMGKEGGTIAYPAVQELLRVHFLSHRHLGTIYKLLFVAMNDTLASKLVQPSGSISRRSIVGEVPLTVIIAVTY